MELIDNINRLLGDDLKQTIKPGARLKIAASCFSMYAFEALKAELEKVEELNFIFTSPTFVANEVTDEQKYNKISNLITKLRRRDVIVNTGSDSAPCWHLAKRLAEKK